MKLLDVLSSIKYYWESVMTAVENYPLTVSIDNHIDVYPLNNSNAFCQVDEKDNIFIFGTNYIFKLKIRKSDVFINQRFMYLEDWISYVIHAGICLLNTSSTELSLKIGITLKDYYQNYADFSNIVATKKVKFLFNGNMKNKPIYIRQFDIYPNLYGQALFISENNNLDNFVVLSFSMETLEGIYFERDKPFLSQRYVLGSGFKQFVQLQESSSYFDAVQLLEELRSNVDHQHFELFYDKYITKKIQFICKKSKSIKIFYIENGEVLPTFHTFFKKKLAETAEVEAVYEGSSVAANGLFGIKPARESNATKDISVYVFPDHSTFVMRNED